MVSTPAPRPAKSPVVDNVVAPVVPATCRNVNLEPSASNLVAVDTATLCLINQARLAGGLVPLAGNADLQKAAVAHSIDMVGEDYFDHVGPNGLTPGERDLASGFVPTGRAGEMAENIAAATLVESTPAATVASWMASPDHRANILNPDFRVTGVGATNGIPAVLANAAGGTYTEDFG